MFRPRLRARNGCQRCKRRRKKCDGVKPTCYYCRQWGLVCLWPGPGKDQHQQQQPGTLGSCSRSSSDGLVELISDPNRSEPNVDRGRGISRLNQGDGPPYHEGFPLSLWSESVAQQAIWNDLRAIGFRHFITQFQKMMLLPECDSLFYQVWANTLQQSMKQIDCLQYAALANAASHLYYIHGLPQLQDFAFVNYVTTVNKLLAILQASETRVEECDGFLTSVMLLYVHGYTGCGTYAYAPIHLGAAMQILRLRYSSQPRISIKALDRITIESVMFHISFLTLGCWSDTKPIDQLFDYAFWLRCEHLLDHAIFFPGHSTSLNSPVIGVPHRLLRLALLTHQVYWQTNKNKNNDDDHIDDSVSLEQIQEEMQHWETAVQRDLNLDHPTTTVPIGSDNASICADAASLYVVVISLLVNRIISSAPISSHNNHHHHQSPTLSSTTSADWQIWKALQILSRRRRDETWAAAFVGNWPVYTFGYLTHTRQAIGLVRHDMRRRWDLQRFAMLARYADDLENVWSDTNTDTNTNTDIDTNPDAGRCGESLTRMPMITIGS